VLNGDKVGDIHSAEGEEEVEIGAVAIVAAVEEEEE
jgi:hypothetical protein